MSKKYNNYSLPERTISDDLAEKKQEELNLEEKVDNLVESAEKLFEPVEEEINKFVDQLVEVKEDTEDISKEPEQSNVSLYLTDEEKDLLKRLYLFSDAKLLWVLKRNRPDSPENEELRVNYNLSCDNHPTTTLVIFKAGTKFSGLVSNKMLTPSELGII